MEAGLGLSSSPNRRHFLSKRYSSGLKARRQDKVRNQRNSAEKSFIKTMIKKTLASIASGNKEESKKAYHNMSSALDKGVKHGILHKNRAARKKARVSKKIAALG